MTARKKYTQADLRALEEIKCKLRSRVFSEYDIALKSPSSNLSECKKKTGKELTKKVEDAIMTTLGKKFNLKRLLSCKVGASHYDHPTKCVCLGFQVDIPTDDIDALESSIKEFGVTRDYKLKQIEDWEIEALQFIAARKGEDGTAYFPAIPEV